uniref:Integron gene cassette protein n=1 Tax=Brugia timori TaxID=42155 RepID=A0A0R3QPN1_9BILA
LHNDSTVVTTLVRALCVAFSVALCFTITRPMPS